MPAGQSAAELASPAGGAKAWQQGAFDYSIAARYPEIGSALILC